MHQVNTDKKERLTFWAGPPQAQLLQLFFFSFVFLLLFLAKHISSYSKGTANKHKCKVEREREREMIWMKTREKWGVKNSVTSHTSLSLNPSPSPQQGGTDQTADRASAAPTSMVPDEYTCKDRGPRMNE
ncbi:hypothetical protein TorRG33x02_188120 [Trema orientale]|uniref:Transmembrane protein n=1 Tax=Trema orientale TaxID=63057 RepID=A0A2P5EIP5_TREOI|nr:hypothetical protein TorRG33x02_188120 [Trema orientale]